MAHATGNGRQQPADRADLLLDLVRRLTRELHPQAVTLPEITLDSLLDRDLGLDSLARVELLNRIEDTFRLRLPEQVLAGAETPRDLLRHLDRGDRRPEPVVRPGPGPAPVGMETEQGDLAPHAATTLPEVLAAHAAARPDRLHLLLETRDGDEPLTYRDLDHAARSMAAGLQRHGLQAGETVAIMLPTGLDYFFTFFGILLAGGVPVPLYPPARPSQIEEHLRRHQAILANCGARFLVADPGVKGVAGLLKGAVASLERVATVAEFRGRATEFTAVPIHADDIAFLQYTSGSTGDPKGVILTHANLLANIRAMGQACAVNSGDIFVSWLPLYHDMGLIGAWLGSLYHGCRLVIMPPLSFLARPERWLAAITRHRGTLSASPNFGYEFCCRRIGDAALADLDLGSWRLAFNGAEPVSPVTIGTFCQRFAGCGFRREAMTPVYGLAESSVGLAFPPPGRGPLIDRVRRGPLVRDGRALPAAAEDDTALQFAGCGFPLPGHQVRVVDESDRELPERTQGRLQFKGPSATSGYFRNPEQTRSLFHGPWLDTGDLAYIAGGEIFLTGRVKEIIIRGGRNIYPHELEGAVNDIEGIRRGCTAVFGATDPETGTERLVVLAESRKQESRALETMRQQINEVTVDLLGSPPDDVVIAPPGTVLKTSSGKIRRTACRALYEQGRLTGPQRAVWLQLVRLFLAGLAPRARRFLRRSGEYLYAAWCWLLLAVLALVTWPAVVLLPVRRWRWRLLRGILRLLALLTGTGITVRGRNNLADPSILVANHASYLDGLVLAAALPVHPAFVAKAELAANPVSRLFLSRLGVIFVERFDFEKSVEDARRIGELVRAGERVLFFAEGTLQRMPGLLPFQMGAFVAAAREGAKVTPIIIRGTRNKLRADSWFPRPGAVHVSILSPILPDGDDWAAAIRLRDRVRKEILRRVGEPDLATVYTSLAQMDIERPEQEQEE